MKIEKVYIAGCGGMLGDAFYKKFKEKYEILCTDIALTSNWLHYCDFRKKQHYYDSVCAFSPDILVHLGAHTDLEYCEMNADDAYLTNTIAVEHACTIAKALKIPIVYIGTAGIFDGKKPLFDDWDTPNPIGVYARTKYLGEKIVQESGLNYLICRAGWMMGGGPGKDKKFVNKIVQQLRTGATELFVVDDKLGTPTYTDDFAENVLLLLEQEEWGLYNLVCEGETSRLEVASEILKILGLKDHLPIRQVSSQYFSKDYFAPRPDSERLVNRKLNLKGMNVMRDWRICLTEYLETCFYEKD